jgi:crotonobetainyl-CoA:carnitine CoA-transferase CaiB-like acyl-CoA transferase
VGTIEPKFWQELCSLIGREDLANRQFDFAHGEELEQTLAKVFLLKTQQDFISVLLTVFVKPQEKRY